VADPRLARETDVFARYLIGAPAGACAAERYAAGHAGLPPTCPAAGRVLVGVAAVHPLLTRIADAYARLLAPRSLLRHKLVLLLAILESSAGSHAAFAPRPGSPLGVVFRLAATGAVFAVCLVAGIILLGPLHLISRVTGAGR